MAVPKKRKSRAKRDSRRATHSISAAPYNECEKCNASKRPHHVCGECGWYKDRYVLVVQEVEYDDGGDVPFDAPEATEPEA